MADRIVSQPADTHRCGPNDYGYWLEHSFDQPGTVRQCECGKTWVAYKDHGDRGYMGVKWRREGGLAWWRRNRTAKTWADPP